MNSTAEIKLQLLNIDELFRSPVSLYRKRILETDAEEFIVEEAEVLPRKASIMMKVHLSQRAGTKKYKRNLYYRLEHSNVQFVTNES